MLIAVILTSVLLAIGLALIDVAYKQLVLASTVKQSEAAFYAADAGLECALYWDQQQGAFSYSTPLSSINCGSRAIAVTSSVSGSTRTSSFSMTCPDGTGTRASIVAYKTSAGATALYSSGYSSCSTSDPRRVERGLKVTF
ncbi:MAG TPA: hypothetical protein VHO23_01980 [Candidatus Paceibacterota bacterium]|nr:hypothetical protein [Candidatus Paceibacterota bacterium]